MVSASSPAPWIGLPNTPYPDCSRLQVWTRTSLQRDGLTFCFTTPVFLFLLVLFYPKVNAFAYRITAFNGLLYGLFNMTHFFNPQLRWMGILHLPLLVISLCALLLPRILVRARGVA